MTGKCEESILIVDDNIKCSLHDLFAFVVPLHFRLVLTQTLGHAKIVLKSEKFSLVVINMSSTGGSVFDFIRGAIGVNLQTQFALLVPENFEGFDLMQKSKHILKITLLERIPHTPEQALKLLNRTLKM